MALLDRVTGRGGSEEGEPEREGERTSNLTSLAVLDEPPASLPRTSAQKQAEVRAAGRIVDVAARVAASTEDLEAYFPRIQRRFQLTRIGFEAGGDERFAVAVVINPEVRVEAVETLEGTGLAGMQTRITFGSGRLGGSTVGAQMTATWLGPDHTQGGLPRSGGQDALMDKLVTTRSNPNDKKYVRGHLLNDNIGGPGTAEDLYPITVHANAHHERDIERQVKTWVNDEKFWVRYSVTVIENDVDLSHADITKNKVNADFRAEASLMQTSGRPLQTINALIRSVYEARPDTETGSRVHDAAGLAGHSARAEDSAAGARLSSRHGSAQREYRLDAGLLAGLGWAGLGWAGLGWAGLGWAGLGWAGTGSEPVRMGTD